MILAINFMHGHVFHCEFPGELIMAELLIVVSLSYTSCLH